MYSLSCLKESIEKLGVRKGTIATLDHEDKLGNISVVTAWKWVAGGESIFEGL